MNSSNNLTIEQKIRHMVASYGSMCGEGGYAELPTELDDVVQQLLNLISEERIDELETTIDKWNDTDLRGFIEYASDRLQALKQERRNE